MRTMTVAEFKNIVETQMYKHEEQDRWSMIRRFTCGLVNTGEFDESKQLVKLIWTFIISLIVATLGTTFVYYLLILISICVCMLRLLYYNQPHGTKWIFTFVENLNDYVVTVNHYVGMLCYICLYFCRKKWNISQTICYGIENFNIGWGVWKIFTSS